MKKHVDEGKRLRLFIEREELTQYDLAEIVGKGQSTINKYLDGSVKIPLEVVKTLHIKLKLNYSWFFHGEGSMKLRTPEEKKILHNLVDIEAGVGALIAKQESMDETLRKLYRDFYAHIRNSMSPEEILRDTTGTQSE